MEASVELIHDYDPSADCPCDGCMDEIVAELASLVTEAVADAGEYPPVPTLTPVRDGEPTLKTPESVAEKIGWLG